MSHKGLKSKQRKKKARKEKRDQQLLLQPQPDPRDRSAQEWFHAKARTGDAAEVRFDFRNAIQVPFDPKTENPELAIRRLDLLTELGGEGEV